MLPVVHPHSTPGRAGRIAAAGRHGRPRGLHVAALLGATLLLVLFAASIKLPKQKMMLEDEIESLFEHHQWGLHHGGGPPACDCSHPTGLGGAPLLCRLGLPPNETLLGAAAAEGGSAAAADGGAAADGEQQQAGQQADGAAAAEAGQQQEGDGQQAAAAAQQQQQQRQQQRPHRLAVLIPYRDRQAHLEALLAALPAYLTKQGTAHDVFVLEQGDGYLFNRGALLNAGALLLAGSEYDHFVFQDVDTVPLEKGGIRYSFPRGPAPLHLTPHWVHPKSTFEDFFGGLLIITSAQFRAINGFGTQFWGWGREDDNLRERLVRAGMWPPEYPPVPRALTGKRLYFQHQRHKQAQELRGKDDGAGHEAFFQENPRVPYHGAKIMSSQPALLRDTETGLNTTMFRVRSMQPFLGATKISLHLHCNTTATPWCDPSAINAAAGLNIKHAAAVHAVGGFK